MAETVSVFRYYAGWADKIYGQTIDVGNAKLAYTKHEPLGMYAPWEYLGGKLADGGLGVCGQIIPWNFPVMVRICPFRLETTQD